MSYVKAADILPQELLEIIQNYIDGEYIYIPRKEGNKKNWGEKTNTREENIIRNKSIYEEYESGNSIKFLAKKYYLSEKSIQRIISQIKGNITENMP